MEATVADVKLCGICGKDCASRPRLRDVLGNYTCRECYQRTYGEQGPVPKRCEVCKRDCSTRARLRNKQGEYTCRECFERMRERVEKAIRRRRRRAARAAAAATTAPEPPSLALAAAVATTPPTAAALPAPPPPVILELKPAAREAAPSEPQPVATTAPTAPVEPVHDDPAELRKAKPARVCPGCGARLRRRTVLCLACGFNQLVGEFTGPIIVGGVQA